MINKNPNWEYHTGNFWETPVVSGKPLLCVKCGKMISAKGCKHSLESRKAAMTRRAKWLLEREFAPREFALKPLMPEQIAQLKAQYYQVWNEIGDISESVFSKLEEPKT